MIVLAIVAALMLIVIPSYFGYAKKARRAEAKAALTGLTIAMERYYTEQSPSTYVGSRVQELPEDTYDPNDIYPGYVPRDEVDNDRISYQLRIVSSSATGYRVTATPVNSQASDDCGTLSINNLGVKGVSSSTVDNCWD